MASIIALAAPTEGKQPHKRARSARVSSKCSAANGLKGTEKGRDLRRKTSCLTQVLEGSWGQENEELRMQKWAREADRPAAPEPGPREEEWPRAGQGLA